MASEKQDYSSAMAINESWLESYWKFMPKIVSSNKSSVTKNLQELEHVTIEEWKKIPEKTCSNLIKTLENIHRKL